MIAAKEKQRTRDFETYNFRISSTKLFISLKTIILK